MEASASQELNWGRDILICIRNFGFRCNLVREEEERVQTRVSRLGGFYVIEPLDWLMRYIYKKPLNSLPDERIVIVLKRVIFGHTGLCTDSILSRASLLYGGLA